MKTRLIALLLSLITLLSVFTSCAGGDTGTDEGGDAGTSGGTDGGDAGGEGEDGTDGEQTSDSKVVPTAVVYSEFMTSGVDLRQIANKCQLAYGKRLPMVYDTEEAAESEIAIGDTSREITAKAQRRLKRFLIGSEDQEWSIVNYGILVKDGSIALVWDRDRAASYAVEYLGEVIATRSDELVNGFCEFISYDIYPEMKASEDKLAESYLKAIEEKFDTGVRNAVADYLREFDSDILVWIANLYEPRTCICDNYDEYGARECLLPKDEDGNYLCHGGGFYYSNSARNTPGFDIDIESTAQVLSFIIESGMIDHYGSIAKALPRQMRNDIVAFTKSLQDPKTGYVYHPQWGSDISESRKARDIGWSVDVLGYFGEKIPYDTPTGVKGSLGAPGQTSLTERLGTDTATLVSKVTAVAAFSKQLQSLEAFREYLTTFDIKNKSYSMGNQLSSQMGMMRQRDKEGIANGEFTDADGDGIAEDGLYMECINFFLDNMNPENGLWEDNVDYNSVNALMKIGSTLHSCGIEIPYADKALESAITMALWDPDEPDVKGKRPTGFVDVFNPWVCINKVKQNINKYGDAEEKARFSKILRENAEVLIRTTLTKAKKFEKHDGSFGYTWTTSPSTSQGVPASVPGSIEGDINGGLMIKGSWTNMCHALGLKADIYYPSDFEMFIHIINKLEPVIKIVPEDDDRTVLDFEECDIGETMPDRVSYSTYEGGMSVVADPKNAANKVIRFYHNPSSIGASRLYITPTGSHNPTALVFETDIYIESATETSTALQMRIAGYLFTMGFKNGKATLGDASSTDSKVSKYNGFGEVFKMGEWHNLRVEFYPNIGDGTCRAKLYVDDVLVGVSKNFEGAHNAGATPSTSFNYVSIYTLIASKESILLDNIHCFKDTLVYKEEEVGATRK